MSASLLFFILIALVILALLLWASRSPKPQFPSGLDAFEALSESRHCSRLPQILRALQPEDTEYLRKDGHAALMHTVRQQRRRIALAYVEQLQNEFETLLEISRVLAVMSPEVIATQEFERWKLSTVFAMNCAWLRWRLRLGLRPFAGLALLTGMATNIIRQLEAAISGISQAAVMGSEVPAVSRENHEDT
ncbi:MAG TPA: hypothetical protein VJX70_11320 [Candidatus Acidoferrum sp.]|nr:hypothetical protein [Candidatus Acidoferrum sp.]